MSELVGDTEPRAVDASDFADRKAMGDRLRIIRTALGLTQQDLAARMDIAATALSAWEGGCNAIDIVKLARIATRFGFTVDYVARGDLSGLRKELADKIDCAPGRTDVRRGRPRGSNNHG